MKTFYISVTETLNRVVAVDAEDLDEAIEKVENACNSSVVDLTAEDFVGREFENETVEVEQSILYGCVEASQYQKI